MADLVITLRSATAHDEPFLERLFRETRAAEFSALDDVLAAQLLGVQFRAQRGSFASQFNPADDLIVVAGDEPIGRMWVHSDGSRWELVDIAVLPENQGCGVASVLLRDLVAQADANAATVHLTVRNDNLRAQRLYFRLGFSVESSSDTDLGLLLRPPSVQAERFERFRRLVLDDEQLQAKLRGVARDGFAEAAADLAHELGIDIDIVDVETAIRTARAGWFEQWV